MVRTNLARHWMALAVVIAGFGCGVPGLAAEAAPQLLPHEARPNDWPQPDYFAEALRQTDFKVSEAARSVSLRAGTAPQVIVLPVQAQAFGTSPRMTALIGAHLDLELAGRDVTANRQTDVIGLQGPTVRRLDDESVAALGRQFPQARMLALYVGHDGAGSAFVTLVLRDGERLTRAHRSVKLPAKGDERLAAVTATLPALLTELGLPLRKAESAPATPQGCTPEHWVLADLDAKAGPGARACHAIIVGTLLPEFEQASQFAPALGSVAKQAWLASAYVQAGALAPRSDTYQAISQLAWSQMQPDDRGETSKRFVDAADPVVKPLARLLWAWPRARSSPASSQRGAALDYVAQAASGVPPFVRAVLVEQAGMRDAFRTVDLCDIELAYPGMKLPDECTDQKAGSRATGPATSAMVSLVMEWRLARHYKDIRYVAITQGHRDRVQQLLARLPAAAATHPYIRMLLAQTSQPDAESTGSFDDWLVRVRSSTRDKLQSTVDLQRWAGVQGVSSDNALKNGNVRNDAEIRRLTEAGERLQVVLALQLTDDDESHWRWAPGTQAGFLQPSPLKVSAWSQLQSVHERPALPPPPPAVGTASAPAAGSAPAAPMRLFSAPVLRTGSGLPEDQLRSILVEQPRAMEFRVELAMLLLKQGRPIEEVTAVIDAHPTSRRSDDQVSESHRMAAPADALFFAAEPGLARPYYEKVRQIGTGSGSDMHAAVRLSQIQSDIAGGLKGTEARLLRYPSDFVRRDLAGYLFMTGQADRAWAEITPRMAMADKFALWDAAMAGHRMEGKSLGEIRGWVASHGLERAQINSMSSAMAYLHRHATVDRIPSDDDIAELAQPVQQIPSNYLQKFQAQRLVASARLNKLILEDHIDKESLERIVKDLQSVDRQPLRSQYAWVAWTATQGADPNLQELRQATPASDVDSVLAKALILGLEGQSAEALTYLRAARYALSDIAVNRLNDDFRSTPYQVALSSYLLFRKTGEKVYRNEALTMAQGYAKVFPFMAWTYGLQALLEPDPTHRATAACRARRLDAGSMFLRLSGLKPDLNSAACRKALW